MRVRLLTIASVVLGVLTVLTFVSAPFWMLGTAYVTSLDENATRYTFWLAVAEVPGILAALWGALWLAARLTRQRRTPNH